MNVFTEIKKKQCEDLDNAYQNNNNTSHSLSNHMNTYDEMERLLRMRKKLSDQINSYKDESHPDCLELKLDRDHMMKKYRKRL